MSSAYPGIEGVKIHSEWGHKLATSNQHRRSKSQVTLREANVQGKLSKPINWVVLNHHWSKPDKCTWLLVSAL